MAPGYTIVVSFVQSEKPPASVETSTYPPSHPLSMSNRELKLSVGLGPSAIVSLSSPMQAPFE